MRTTKVMAFSVPPELEFQILSHAKIEHRTVSEYLREAVRRYMSFQEFEITQKSVAAKMKRRKLRPADVEETVEKLRKKS